MEDNRLLDLGEKAVVDGAGQCGTLQSFALHHPGGKPDLGGQAFDAAWPRLCHLLGDLDLRPFEVDIVVPGVNPHDGRHASAECRREKVAG